MSTVLPTDKMLVQRGTALHSAPADMSTVQDTDLLLINRAGVDYKCSFLDWKASQGKPPAIASVTLADSPEAGRFTSGTFRSTTAMADEGTPASAKGIKAYVQGTLKSAAQTDAITQVVVDPILTTYDQRWPTAANPAAGDLSSNFDVGCVMGPWNAQTVGGTVVGAIQGAFTDIRLAAPAAPVYGIHDAGYLNGQTGYDIWAKWSNDGTTFTPWKVVSSNLIPGKNSAYTPPAEAKYWRFAFTPHGSTKDASTGATAFYGILVNVPLATLTFASSTGLASFASGDAVKEVGGGDDAKASCVKVDATANTMVVSSTTGTWDVGSAVKGPLKAPAGGAATKLYCKLNAGLTVTDLQSADPGFTAVTGAGPYTVTFPALLPSGNAPDADLPVGTTITTEVRAVNASATVSKASNTVTPA